MTIIILAVIGIVILGVAIHLLTRKSQHMTQEDLIELSEDMNKECPKIVAENVRLDRVSVEQDMSMIYTYTMLKVDPNALTEENLNNMKQSLLQHYKTAKDFAIFRKNNVGVIFVYKNTEGNELLSLECK